MWLLAIFKHREVDLIRKSCQSMTSCFSFIYLYLICTATCNLPLIVKTCSIKGDATVSDKQQSGHEHFKVFCILWHAENLPFPSCHSPESPRPCLVGKYCRYSACFFPAHWDPLILQMFSRQLQLPDGPQTVTSTTSSTYPYKHQRVCISSQCWLDGTLTLPPLTPH